MKMIPDQQLNILSEEQYPEGIRAICDRLNSCRQSGHFQGLGAQSLFYEYFLAQNSRGSVVLVHGLSEFTEKYYEFAYYLLQQGYDVFLYDQRCHGRSGRLTDHPGLIHVDRFSDYVEDLDRFIAQVVRPATQAPLYLYAHSMGCAVAIRYMAQHPEAFRKALLSAPMIQPLTGSIPPFLARLLINCFLIFGDSRRKFWFSNEFNPNYQFRRSNDSSYARFVHNMQLRRTEPCYQTTPLSTGWIRQSLLQYRHLCKKSVAGQLRTPILMLSAEHDTVVSSRAQRKFAAKCPNCRRIVLKDTKHAMLGCKAPAIREHLQLVLDHFR